MAKKYNLAACKNLILTSRSYNLDYLRLEYFEIYQFYTNRG